MIGTVTLIIKDRHQRIHPEQVQEIIAFCGAARGTTMETTFALRIETGTFLRIPVTTLVSAAPARIDPVFCAEGV